MPYVYCVYRVPYSSSYTLDDTNTTNFEGKNNFDLNVPCE